MNEAASSSYKDNHGLGELAAQHSPALTVLRVVAEALQSGEPVHLGIRPTDAAGAGGMIRVRRLPLSAKLTLATM